MVTESDFRNFLAEVDLNAYRERYRPIKIVEMDLPKDIQALKLMYELYWDKRQLLNYDEFYAAYATRYAKPIEAFRQKTTMCKDCFGRGLPARIYRTWASIITQIHAGYVAETVFGPGSVTMSEELDHKGADFQVTYVGKILNYQVKKQSMSREVRTAKTSKNPIPGIFIDIWYDVPSSQYFVNPYKKSGDYRAPYLKFVNNKDLERLPNGFVIFTPAAFLRDKQQLDSGQLK